MDKMKDREANEEDQAGTGSQTSRTISTADFEQAIKETGCGRFNYIILLLSIPAGASIYYDMTSLSFALPAATCDLQLSAYDRGFLNGAIYAGMILSAPFVGYISDKFGRKRVLVFGFLADLFFGVCVSLSQSFWPLLLFKVLCGVVICGPSSVVLPYLSELTIAKHRDFMMMLVGLFQAVGSIFQSLIALAIIPQKINWSLWDGQILIDSWRVFMLVCTVPSLMAGVGAVFCHESPRFLMAKGRTDEALGVFRSIYSTNTGKPANTYPVKKLKSELQEVECSGNKASLWQEMTALFHPPYLYLALLAFSIQTGCLLSLNTVRLWLPQLFSFIKQTDEGESLDTCHILSSNITDTDTTDCTEFIVHTSVYKNMLYINLLTCVSFVVSVAIVAYWGKRNLLVTLCLLQSAVLCGLGWVRPPLTIVLAAIFVALSTTTCLGLMLFVVQIFPTSIRTMAVSLTLMVAQIGVVLGNASLPFFLSLTCHGTFIGISFITFMCGVALCVLAAAGKTTQSKHLPGH